MDLRTLLFNRSGLLAVLSDAKIALQKLEAGGVRQALHEDLADLPKFETPAPELVSKPKTISEFRSFYAESECSDAAVGDLFLNDNADLPLWELQYMFFFVLYSSTALRTAIARESPLAVGSQYLRVFGSHFERHVSGMHQTDVPQIERELLGSQSPLEFVVLQAIKVNELYGQ